MTTSARPMTNAEAAQAIARALGPVLPLCYTDDVDGQPVCACGGHYDLASKTMVPHTGHDLGKAPITALVRNGVDDAIKNSATIDRWWRTHPRANVGVALKPSSLVFVDPDSTAAYAEAIAQGVEGGVLRTSRNDGFLFKRPKDWPVLNISKAGDKTDLEIRADGYAVVWGLHANGAQVRVDLDAKLEYALSWIGDRLKAKAVQKAASEGASAKRREERAGAFGAGQKSLVRLRPRQVLRWTGELVECKPNGDVDRSASLFMLGLDQAEAGADVELVAAAVAERDVALGWNKFSGRADDVEYVRIAEKAVARAIELEQAPVAKAATAAPDGSMDDVLAFAEATANENARLRRVIRDQGDRLEVLEPIVTAIDEILARPEIETDDDGNVIRYGPTSDDKLVDIQIARFMPHWRTRQVAKGQEPTIALNYLAKVLGMSSRRISKSLDRQSSDDPKAGAPFRKRVTRRYLDDEQRWESSLEVIPWGNSPAETLQRAAVYALPARPKHGGSAAATAIRWGECDKHDNDAVRIKGYCPECGRVVGETMVTRDAFDALNVQLGHSEGEQGGCVGSNSISVQVEHSDDARAAAMVGTPEPTRDPVRLDDRRRVTAINGTRLTYATSEPQPHLPVDFEGLPPPVIRDTWKCPVILPSGARCSALAGPVGPDGSWECVGRRHRASEPLLAVAGGEE